MLFLGLSRTGVLFSFLLATSLAAEPVGLLTPPAAGPYRVAGNRILDSQGRPYLARGTELPTLTLRLADIAGDGHEFGPFSPSSLISIRQRLNMNAVRLPVNPLAFEQSRAYRRRVAEVIGAANRFELLVILAADPAPPPSREALRRFWTLCATEFAGNPNLFFAPSLAMHADVAWSSWQRDNQALVDAIRSAGAPQPVLIAGFEQSGFTGLTTALQISRPNIIYETTPRYATTRTAADRERQYGLLAGRAPVMVDDMDPQLDTKSPECAAFPSDPGAATQ